MKLKLDFEIPSFGKKLKHSDRIILLGSCFSVEIGKQLEINGFDVLPNPFGTIFHPEPIAKILSDAILENKNDQIFQRKDLFFSWKSAGTVYDFTEEALKNQLQMRRKKLLEYLKSAKYLFLTFGSAFGYHEKESGEVVANCHKMPSNHFDKKLSAIDPLISSWTETLNLLHNFNPDLQVILTVSPVRHAKDGLIENNRSKARLFDLVSALENLHFVNYFPAYEIVIDELRDYRFYKIDGVHPNELAISYVWEKLKSVLFEPETLNLCDQIIALRNSENHRSLQPDSAENKLFKQHIELKIRDFLAMNIDVKWHEKS